MEINYAYQMTYTDPYLSLKLNQKTNKKLNQTTSYGRRRRLFSNSFSRLGVPHTNGLKGGTFVCGTGFLK